MMVDSQKHFLNKKRLVCVALTVCLTLANAALPPVGAAGLERFAAPINSESRKVTVQCTVSDPAPVQWVNFFVLKPGFTPQSVSDLTLSDALFQHRQMKTGANGAAEFAFSLTEDDPSGFYSVVAGINGVSLPLEQRTRTFYYANTEEIEAAKFAVNSANADNFAGILREFNIDKPILGLSFDGDYLATEARTAKVNTALLALRDSLPGKSFASVGEIQTHFAMALGWTLLNEAAPADAAYILRNYGAALGIGAEADYTGYPAVHQNLYDILISHLRKEETGGQFASAEAIRQRYAQALAIALVNYVGAETMVGVLERHNAVLGLPLSGAYEALGTSVTKALVEKGFTGIGQIQSAFAARMEELSNTKEESVPSLPKGRTGMGGGGTVFSFDQPAPSPQPAAEPKARGLFSDLDNAQWARESIEALAEQGIINGVSENLFAPDEQVTREQFVKMIVAGLSLLDPGASVDLDDVSPGQWYYPYVASAGQKGITLGIGDRVFGIGRSITREEMAAICYRAATAAEVALPSVREKMPFRDEAEISSYAIESVYVMQRAGILQGTGGDEFEPGRTATRAEAAKLVYYLRQLAGNH